MKKKKIIRISIYIVITLAVLYFLVNLVMLLLIRNDADLEVPDLTGITVADGYDRLTALHLFLVKDGEQYNAVISSGAIVSQVPLPGSKVKAGRKIKVIVSRGSEKVDTPNVTYKSWRDAEIVLRQAGLIVGETLRIYSDREQDTVIIQDPMAGISLEKGSSVNLIVSAGRIGEGAIMPNLLSRPYEQVGQIIRLMGLQVSQVTTEVNDNIASGTVIAQIPEANNPLTKDTVVSLVISVRSGEELVSPEVKIIHYEVAQGLLGKRVRITITDEEGEREVFDQTQAPGTKLNVAASVKGQGKAKIYVNELLVEERQL
ncbi:MAG: PASTA domain-containing protein [bacterium]|nr:PASTA domain-containing protein [bacterium]MDD5353974.1 PASTA domain-containing protein [bacterium]MDD5756053.1 PASTA domain-containing protein [bacterium]